MQESGLEWAFRLGTEPRRLWRRYFRYNPRFVSGFARQYLGHTAGAAPHARLPLASLPRA